MGSNQFLLVLVILCGCGASNVGDEGARTDRELAPMHGTLGAFHDVLAPVYHMDKGSERDARACTSAPEMEARAENVVKDLRADKDPAFKAASQGLRKSVGDLENACSEHDGVEAKLAAVHDAFHATLEAAHEGEVGHDEKDEAAHGHDTNHP